MVLVSFFFGLDMKKKSKDHSIWWANELLSGFLTGTHRHRNDSEAAVSRKSHKHGEQHSLTCRVSCLTAGQRLLLLWAAFSVDFSASGGPSSGGDVSVRRKPTPLEILQARTGRPTAAEGQGIGKTALVVYTSKVQNIPQGISFNKLVNRSVGYVAMYRKYRVSAISTWEMNLPELYKIRKIFKNIK